MADERQRREVPRFDEETEAELDHLSSIAPEDVQRAQQAWAADAPREWKDALGKPPKGTQAGQPNAGQRGVSGPPRSNGEG